MGYLAVSWRGRRSCTSDSQRTGMARLPRLATRRWFLSRVVNSRTLRPNVTDAKHCPYCGVAHDNRGRACCAEHERKIRAHKGAVTAGRNRARKRLLAAQQKRVLHRTRWRSIAMGRDVAKNLSAIFGDKAPRLFEP